MADSKTGGSDYPLVPIHMQDFYKCLMKGLLGHDALQFGKAFAEIINMTVAGCPQYVPASAMAFKAVVEHPMDYAVEDVAFPMLTEKQLLFFLDTVFFKGYLKKNGGDHHNGPHEQNEDDK